jgi:nucleoside-diphosphate-sugar epimerase
VTPPSRSRASHADALRGTRALVTGVSGFVGRHLANALFESGVGVIGLARDPLEAQAHVEVIAGNISDRSHVADIVRHTQPDYVFHLAAEKARTTDLEDFRSCFETNLIGTLNLVEACAGASQLRRFIALGTCEEYAGEEGPYSETMRETPASAYSCSKVAMTQLLQTCHRVRGFPAVVLRPSLAYGPGQGGEMFLPALMMSLLEERRFAMTAGEQLRDFVYVDDLVDAMLQAALAHAVPGEIINISSGEPIALREVAVRVAKLIGPGAEDLLDVGTVAYRDGEAITYWADRAKAERLLGWQPTVSLATGLARTIAYYRTRAAAS